MSSVADIERVIGLEGLMYSAASEKATATSKDTKASKDTMLNEGGHMAREEKENLHHLKDDAREAAKAVKEDIEDVARHTGQHVRDLADSVSHNYDDINAMVIKSIRRRPLLSVGAAVAGGLFIGLLYRR